MFIKYTTNPWVLIIEIVLAHLCCYDQNKLIIVFLHKQNVTFCVFVYILFAVKVQSGEAV